MNAPTLTEKSTTGDTRSPNQGRPGRCRGCHAECVAWRLVYHWIDVQRAFVEAGLAAMAERLLGFALSTHRDGEDVPKTFYEVLLDAEGPKRLAEHL